MRGEVKSEVDGQRAAQAIAWEKLWSLLLAPPFPPVASLVEGASTQGEDVERENKGHSPVIRQTSGATVKVHPTQPIIRQRKREAQCARSATISGRSRSRRKAGTGE